MNRSELIRAVAYDLDMTQSGVARVLDAITAVVTDCVREHEEVRIHNFIVINVEHKAERTGRNPATGEAIQIPAKNVVKIKPLGDLAAAAK